jgi:hypothetical protein
MWLCVKMENHKATKSIKQLCELCGYVLKWKTTKSQSAKSSYVNYVAMC